MNKIAETQAAPRGLWSVESVLSGDDLALLDGAVTFPADCHGDPVGGQSLSSHLGAVGPRPRGAEQLVDYIDAFGLTGRGGSHFPTSRKWRSVRDGTQRTGKAATVVANAAESEPASAKDLALLTQRPHLVLDGLVCTAEAVGATDLVVWAHGDNHPLHRILVQALHERRADLDEPSIRLVSGPARYVSGESSAIVRALAGGPALPQFRRGHATSGQLGGGPTLVHNVETLARIGLLARCGPERAPRTSLVTVLTSSRRTVVEAGDTARLDDTLHAGGWPSSETPRAVLMGGYGGQWLPWSEAQRLRLHEPTLRSAGLSLGAGVLVPLPAASCGLAETARVARFLAESSARQCGPCLFGLPALAGAVEALAVGRASRADLRRMQRWTREVAGRGACHHPDGAVRLIVSALRVFVDDVSAHRRRRPCGGLRAASLLPIPPRAAS
jgi:NADH:ubiquinone oxidoreductase subunit F (NADH-binding)